MKKPRLIILIVVLAVCVLLGILWKSGMTPASQEETTGPQETEPLTGWQEVDGRRYYYDAPDGTLHTGWLELEGSRYYLGEDGVLRTGWLHENEQDYYLRSDGAVATGWQDINGVRYYFDGTGAQVTGWLELEEGRFYLNEDGSMHTGWLELENGKYYLTQTGAAAQGRVEIDGSTYFFTSTGANIILVNPWNYLPEDYEVELVTLEGGHQVSEEMYEPLMRMMEDCRAAGYRPYLCSSYRTMSHQQYLFNNMVNRCDGNRAEAARIVAIPGTSEHQLGLAVDLTDYSYRNLDYAQENTATQQWLMEHCWEYGFILRFPNSKSAVTGIIYEPWHYRYVGVELAMELRDSGLCLEEYLDQLTGDGSTCGGQ